MYFVGAESTKLDLISAGVFAESITVCGVPVKQCFKMKYHTKKQDAKKEILIMGGGLGLIPSSDILLRSLCLMDQIHVTLITGTNEKLLQKIKQQFPQIRAIGYTDRVYDYMEKADLIITKSGGVTVFEAIHSELPLYIIKPFLRQEVYNAEYIERLNIGRVIWSNDADIDLDIISLLQNDLLLATMKNNMRLLKGRLGSTSPLIAYEQRGEALCG